MSNCPVSAKCGACALLGTDYSVQLDSKRNQVAQLFDSAGIKISVHPTVGMEAPFRYRNKVISYVTMKGGKIVLGMYEENTHNIIPTAGCQLHNSVLDNLLDDIRQILDSLKIRSFDHGGVLKNILLRMGVATGQVMVVFVTSDDMFHGRNDLVKRIVAAHREVRTIVQNVNPRDTSVILGSRERVLHGSGFIYDNLMGCRFKISPASFYQINPEQTEKLYSKAIELSCLKPGERLLDAYCGIGTIGICAASKVAGCSVLGVEINRDAVDDARANARAASVRNAVFVCDDVKRFMREFDETVDVLVVDPPRSGCDAEFLNAVKRLRPGRIVYISCNPATQARDVAFLKPFYEVSDAYPFDMFPQTPHVENIVPLTLKTDRIKI